MDGALAPVTAVGPGLTEVEHTVHERRLRAFAAGVGDLSPCSSTSTRPTGSSPTRSIRSASSWLLILLVGPPGLGLDDDAVHAGLDVSHEIIWTRPIRPGDALRTTLRVETLQQRSAGVLAVFAFATTADGEPVVESHQGVLYRGSTLTVEPVGSARPGRLAPPRTARSARSPASASTPPTPSSTASARPSGTRSTPTPAPPGSPACRSRCPRHRDPGPRDLRRRRSRPRGDPTRLARMSVRFTAPIAAGDEATVAATELHDGALAFRTSRTAASRSSTPESSKPTPSDLTVRFFYLA